MRVDPDDNGVAAFLSTRQPNDRASRVRCPACGDGAGFRQYRYEDSKGCRGPNGSRISLRSASDAPDPHLVVDCLACGFWWEQEVCVP